MGNWIAATATLLNFMAAISYGWSGDYARAVYWIGATILTGSTIFIGR